MTLPIQFSAENKRNKKHFPLPRTSKFCSKIPEILLDMSDVKRIKEGIKILLFALLLTIHLALVKWIGVRRNGRAGSESC
jgi:hypothetical protein